MLSRWLLPLGLCWIGLPLVAMAYELPAVEWTLSRPIPEGVEAGSNLFSLPMKGEAKFAYYENLVQEDYKNKQGCVKELAPFLENTVLKNPDIAKPLEAANKKLHEMGHRGFLSLVYATQKDGSILLTPRFVWAGEKSMQMPNKKTALFHPVEGDSIKAVPPNCETVKLIGGYKAVIVKFSAEVDGWHTKYKATVDAQFKRNKMAPGEALGADVGAQGRQK